MKIKLDIHGKVIADGDNDTKVERVIEVTAEGSAHALERAERLSRLNSLRADINQVADQPAREGVMSDVLAVLVVGVSQLSVAIAKAKTLDDIKAAAAPLAVIGEVIDAGIKDGTIKLPYMVKKGGAEAVLQDMVKLSNGVTQVLQSAQKA